MRTTLIVHAADDRAAARAASILGLVLGPAIVAPTDQAEVTHAEFLVLVASAGWEPEVAGWSIGHRGVLGDVPAGVLWLDAEDRDHLEHEIGARAVHQALIAPASADRLETVLREELVDAALAMKARRDADVPAQLPSSALRERIEAFLAAHNTCALAVASSHGVRVVPIEYRYHAGSLYLLSEGGEKFAHLLLAPEVSVCIFEPYRGWANLAGLQLQGRARLLDDDSVELERLLEWEGITPLQRTQLPVALHGIRIDLRSADFLSSAFRAQGLEVRQRYRFPEAG